MYMTYTQLLEAGWDEYAVCVTCQNMVSHQPHWGMVTVSNYQLTTSTKATFLYVRSLVVQQVWSYCPRNHVALLWTTYKSKLNVRNRLENLKSDTETKVKRPSLRWLLTETFKVSRWASSQENSCLQHSQQTKAKCRFGCFQHGVGRVVFVGFIKNLTFPSRRAAQWM